jgi:hypothetical protein
MKKPTLADKKREYVRCRFCDMNWGQQQGFNWEETPKRDLSCGHREANFVCPVCGGENHGFIFEDDKI